MIPLVLCVVFSAFLCLIAFRNFLQRLRINSAKKCVLVTGCDSGFGRALLLSLCDAGVTTFAGCLGDQAVRDLQDLQGVYPLLIDVRDLESIRKARKFVEEVLEKQGCQLWGVVCNAGVLGMSCEDDLLSHQDYLDVFDVNTLGTIRTCQTFKPLIKKAHGRIVVMTSMTGRLAPPTLGPYSVSKYGSEAYADVLRREMRSFDVSVHIICPNVYETNLADPKRIYSVLEERFHQLSEKDEQFRHEEHLQISQARLNSVFKYSRTEIGEVTECYMHALFAKYPRTRYHVGGITTQIWRLLSVLPTYVGDAAIHILHP